MNAPNQWYQEEETETEIEYQVHMRRDVNSPEMKVKRREQARSKNRPSNSNGIHRRHNKRFSW